jgi:metallo-beta-lactamase family protein
VEDTEYLVIESTYGDRLHSEERVDYVKELAARIQTTLDRGGNMIIPSFAVGRTQEMLYFLREIQEKGLVKGHGSFPVYVDSPLAVEATSVFLQCDTQYMDEEMRRLIRSGVNPLVFPGLKLSVSQEESRKINEDREPKVIISASGMCDAGRIRHHLKHNLWRPECVIAFVGYQSEGTLGRKLLEGAKSVRLFSEEITVRAEIVVLPGTSGHADKNGLIDWLLKFRRKPSMVFLNHGDDDVINSFARDLRETYGYDVFAPFSGTVYDLATGAFVTVTEGKPVKQTPEESYPVTSAYKELAKALEQLNEAVKAHSQLSNKELRRLTDKIRAVTASMD